MIDVGLNDDVVIPGLEALKTADLMIIATRFRNLPDEQMKYIVDYVESGRPIIGMRTATHSFNFKTSKTYERWSSNSKEWDGGFGRQVLGETWISHYGDHQKESTRGIVADGMENQPIVRGVGTIWGPSDVYGLTTLNGDCKPVIMGHVLSGMNPDDKENPNKKPLPVAWIKSYTGETGKTARVFTTTMGHAGDLKDANFRDNPPNPDFVEGQDPFHRWSMVQLSPAHYLPRLIFSQVTLCFQAFPLNLQSAAPVSCRLPRQPC